MSVVSTIDAKRMIAMLGLALALLAASLFTAKPAHAASNFPVNSTADFHDANTADGLCTAAEAVQQCTLRAALEQANATPGPDNILLGVPSGTGVATIKPGSPLPTITDRVTIDGYAQPGSAKNTSTIGTNAVLKIELDGTNAGSEASGPEIDSGGAGSVVKGLVINRFAKAGITTLDSDQNTIEGNFIGTDPTGTVALANADGVSLFSSSFNAVGGSTPDKRNLISGNGQGIEIFQAANFNRVDANLIGTKKDGTTALGNRANGVDVGIAASNNTFSSNTIAFNGLDGVGIVSGATSTGNLLAGNSIFSNVQQGIDLGKDGVTPNDGDDPSTAQVDPDNDTGPNQLQNFPVLTSAKTTKKGTTITGKLNSTLNNSFLVQFFSNASGSQKVIGFAPVSTDASGNATFVFKPTQKVSKGKITATAIDSASKNTSEFSKAKKVVRR